MNYNKTNWQDEILAGDKVLYDIVKNNVVVESNVELVLKNEVTNEGTPVSATRLNNIEKELEYTSDFGNTVVFNVDGSITETRNNGYVIVTTFPVGGSIVETVSKDAVLQYTKTTTFNVNGSIEEVIV